MKQMMYVGKRCSSGGHNLTLGKTEIEPNAPTSVLHAQLRREGWRESMEEKCLRKECGAITAFGLGKTRLLGPVVTAENVEL